MMKKLTNILFISFIYFSGYVWLIILKFRQLFRPSRGHAVTGFLIIFSSLFFHSCGLLDNDNNGQCSINCEDWKFMRIDQEPAWSPDGETIAFVRGSTDPAKHGIYLISPNGENLRQFHAGGGNAPNWSPNGEWIAFHQGAQIYKKHTETDSLVQLTYTGRNFNPAWSPNDNWVAYRRSLSGEPNHIQGIWIVDKNNQTHNQIFSGNTGFPSWRTSAFEIAFFRGVITPNGEVLGDSLWIYDLDNKNLRGFAFMKGDNRYPRFSINKNLLFTSQSKGSYPQVWVMNSDETNTTQLTENGGWAADWSPNGDWIVYTETYETGRLWLMRPDGSEKRQLTVE